MSSEDINKIACDESGLGSEELARDLSDVLASLKRLKPSASPINDRQLLFEAGRRSAQVEMQRSDEQPSGCTEPAVALSPSYSHTSGSKHVSLWTAGAAALGSSLASVAATLLVLSSLGHSFTTGAITASGPSDHVPSIAKSSQEITPQTPLATQRVSAEQAADGLALGGWRQRSLHSGSLLASGGARSHADGGDAGLSAERPLSYAEQRRRLFEEAVGAQP